jgi:ABC-type sugar transport system substrate-binding protein
VILNCNQTSSSIFSISDVSNERKSATKRIAVIVKTTNSEFWATAAKGAQDAAKELGVEVLY